MKLFFLLYLSLIINMICSEEEEFLIENDIIVLKDTNFDKALEKYEQILVIFYAQWCAICEKYELKLQKVASELRKENIFIAKVDAELEKNLHKRFQIYGYPKITFFKKGVGIDYDAEKTEQDIIKWLNKKSKPTKVFKTFEEVEKFQKENNVSVVYFGNNIEEFKIYEDVAMKFEDILFGVVEDDEIAKKYNAKQGSVILFKKFDEKRNDLTTFKEKELIEFIEINSERKITPFDKKASSKVFGNNKPAIVYLGEKGDKWNEEEKIMEKVALKVYPKLLFIMTDIKEGMGMRIAEYIGIKKENLPSVVILDTRKDIKKYILEGDINEKNILDFIDGWEKGKIKIHLKTQEEPKENNGDIFVVVGKTFQKEVIENDKDVLIVFYAPWCGHCIHFLPEYEKAAKKLKAKNPKIMLAKMDATENEIESVFIRSFPTIKFYPGNKKDIEPIDFNGERTTEGVIQFLQTNAYNKIVLDEEKKEEKKEEKNVDL